MATFGAITAIAAALFAATSPVAAGAPHTLLHANNAIRTPWTTEHHDVRNSGQAGVNWDVGSYNGTCAVAAAQPISPASFHSTGVTGTDGRTLYVGRCVPFASLPWGDDDGIASGWGPPGEVCQETVPHIFATAVVLFVRARDSSDNSVVCVDLQVAAVVLNIQLPAPAGPLGVVVRLPRVAGGRGVSTA